MKNLSNFLNESINTTAFSEEVLAVVEQYEFVNESEKSEEEVNESNDQMCNHIANIVKRYLASKKLKCDEKGFETAQKDILDKIDDKVVEKVKSLVLESKEEDDNEEVNEGKVESEEDFREYAEKKLKASFGDQFDEKIAKDTIDGIVKKADGKWDEAVGMLTSGLKEELENQDEE